MQRPRLSRTWFPVIVVLLAMVPKVLAEPASVSPPNAPSEVAWDSERGRLILRYQGAAILEAEIEGYAMDDDAFASFFMLLITAGIETTKAAVTGGMLALIEHPDQWSTLLEQRETLPDAIEEMIRWTTPVHHFRRTATRDTEIRGQKIREDDKVVIWYSSANRDEAVFEDPFRFDIARTPNDHLSFGFGRHFCLGANLARLEMKVVFETLLERGAEIEPCGESAYLLSSFTNALKRMPVTIRTTR